MMMKSIAQWALAAVVGVAAAAQAPSEPARLTAAEIVERNAAARGGVEAWRKVETMAWVGRVESANQPGRRMPFVLEQKRPNRTRFELTVDGQKSLRVYDGTDGWKMRASLTSKPELVPYTPDELRFAHGAQAIEGPLMEYAAKGGSIKVDGLDEVDGHKAYALKLVLATGLTYRVWVDAETFLEVRYDREIRNTQGKSAVASVYFGNYRDFEGIKLPMSIETGGAAGTARDKLIIERVVINPHLEDRMFGKPGTAPSRRKGVTVDTRSAASPPNPARASP